MGIPGENVPARTAFTSILSQMSQSKEKGDYPFEGVSANIHCGRVQETCRNVCLVCFLMRAVELEPQTCGGDAGSALT